MKLNLNAVKRAPKWAWWTVAGVGVGVGALKLWGNRTTADGDTPADTGATVDEMGNPTYGPSGGSTGVIVPPVIIPNDTSDQSGTGLGDLQALYLSGVATTIGQMTEGYQMVLGKSMEVTDQSMGITDQVGGLLSQTVGALQDIASQKIALAGGGSAPQPATQYIDPGFAAAISRGDPNATAYVAAGAPYIDPAFAAKVAAGDPATLAFIRAHGG